MDKSLPYLKIAFTLIYLQLDLGAMEKLANTLLEMDYKIFTWINTLSATEWQDQFFPWITDIHKQPYFNWIILPLLIAIFYRKYKRQGISLFLFLLLALGFNDFTGARVKNHYLRLRPFENSEIHAIQRSPAGSKSFYSNHSSNMFTFATYTSLFFPVARIPLFVLASTVAYSRVYNGVHYPSDVMAGAAMGVIWGAFFASLAQRLANRLGPRLKKDS